MGFLWYKNEFLQTYYDHRRFLNLQIPGHLDPPLFLSYQNTSKFSALVSVALEWFIDQLMLHDYLIERVSRGLGFHILLFTKAFISFSRQSIFVTPLRWLPASFLICSRPLNSKLAQLFRETWNHTEATAACYYGRNWAPFST